MTGTAVEPKHDAVPIVKNLVKELSGEVPPVNNDANDEYGVTG